MFHYFKTDISNISLPKRFTNPFSYQAHPLVLIAKDEFLQMLDTMDSLFVQEAENGKMFGVLVCKNSDGKIGYLCAFSGQILGKNTYQNFVEPVFDYTSKESFFVKENNQIILINNQLEELINSNEFLKVKKLLEEKTIEKHNVLENLKCNYKQNKIIRAQKRQDGFDCKILEKESQFEKAEIKRKEKQFNQEIEILQNKLDFYNNQIFLLKQKRELLSGKLQDKLFKQFVFHNFENQSKDLLEIFDDKNQKCPSGAGECSAPRLLEFAIRNNYFPICMGEFWYGKTSRFIIHRSGEFYPSCKPKCEPILQFMLKGLDVDAPLYLPKNQQFNYQIIFEDDDLIVVNKPFGMLSAPGKNGTISIFEKLLADKKSNLYLCHRLDMDTSGILLLAKNLESYQNIQNQFLQKKVAKTYKAILCGKIKNSQGKIDLPIIADYENRPMQKIDKNGKPSITFYKLLRYDSKKDESEVLFFPQTGRTHQLRLHSASPFGLDCPIKGDKLYGKNDQRLFLECIKMELLHPKTNKKLSFFIKNSF